MASLLALVIQPAPKQLEQKPDITVAAATFTLFPKLPPELKLRVWSHTLLDSRTVCIRALGSRSQRRTNKDNTGLSAILSTCVESRMVALNHRTINSSQGEALPKFYDPENDVLRMLDQAAFYEFGSGTEGWLMKLNTWIKHLVLVIREGEDYWHFTFKRLECLTELESLVIEFWCTGPLDMEIKKMQFALVWAHYLGGLE
ncbi:hypothetical protein N431DRAFT_451333 [Stipitochalara longipes BDJ]|nr:hypothetical protein N431DRAFT_451333 [Stipitochalara longipes BDJ]